MYGKNWVLLNYLFVFKAGTFQCQKAKVVVGLLDLKRVAGLISCSCQHKRKGVSWQGLPLVGTGIMTNNNAQRQRQQNHLF